MVRHNTGELLIIGKIHVLINYLSIKCVYVYVCMYVCMYMSIYVLLMYGKIDCMYVNVWGKLRT